MSDRLAGAASTLVLFLLLAYLYPLVAIGMARKPEPSSMTVQVFGDKRRSPPKPVFNIHVSKARAPKLRPPSFAIMPDAPFVFSGTPPATTSDAAYLEQVADHIQRFSDHTTGLQRTQIVNVDLVMDRSGNVLFLTVARSSGSASLDQEALSQIRRAQPLPPIPERVKGDKLYLLVPVCFKAENSLTTAGQASPTSCRTG
jgi:TonB family protein